MIQRVCPTALLAVLLLGGHLSVLADSPLSPNRENPGVTQVLRDYIAAAEAGDVAAMVAMYTEELREDVPQEELETALKEERESIKDFGKLGAVIYIDQDPDDDGTTHFYRVEFAEATCNFTVMVNAENQLNGLTFGKLPDRRFDSPRLERLAKDLEAGDAAALERFWAEVEGHTPLVEEISGSDALKDHAWVTYLWRASNAATKRVNMVGGLDQGDFPKSLHHLEGTDLWYRTDVISKDARYTYMFFINLPIVTMVIPEERDAFFAGLSPRLDRRNPAGFNGASLIELPDAPSQPWIEKNPEAPSGELAGETIRSEILDEDRQITVYTPPGYDGKGKPAGLVIVFDAGVYGANEDSALVPTPTILDNLINSKKIDPMVALLVHNTDRTRDLTCSEDFAGFLATELVPWARDRFHVTKSASRTMVAGSSFGGLISACAALYYPKVFGQVLSQSGSYWYVPEFGDAPQVPGLPAATNWVADQFKGAPRRSTRFYMDVGRFEGPGQVATNRHLRDVLIARGYEVTYREFNGGHDYVCWRGTLADGLLALAGTGD